MAGPISAADVGRRRAALDIAVQVVARVANLALGVGVTVVLVHALGDDGFGQWSTVLAITQIALNFSDLGLEQVTIAKAAAEPAREERWLGALLSLRLALALPATLVAVVAAGLIGHGHARVAGVLLALTLLSSSVDSLRVVFRLRVRNDITTALLTFNSVGWAVAVVAISAAGGGIIWFAALFLGLNVATTALQAVLALRRIRVRLGGSRALWGQLARVGIPIGVGGLLVVAYVRLDQILVYEIAGARQAGLYASAYRILDQAQFLPAAVMTTLFPIIAASHPGDLGRVRRTVQTTAELLAMGSLPALAFAIPAAHPIMRLLFGAEFAPAAPALPILLGAFVLISFGYLAGNLVVVLELQRRFLAYAAAALVFNVTLNAILIPSHGFLAAAWVTLATEVLVTGLTLRSVLRALAMRPALWRLARIAVAAALMGGLVALTRHAGVPLGGLVALAAVAYPVALVALRALTRADVRLITERA